MTRALVLMFCLVPSRTIPVGRWSSLRTRWMKRPCTHLATASTETSCAAPKAQAEPAKRSPLDDPNWLIVSKDALDEASLHSFGYGVD